MANVKFPRKEIEKHFKLDETNLDRIMMLGIPIESLTDNEIEIQVLPNRPDLISMQGFLRAVKLFMGKSKVLQYKISKLEAKIIVDPIVEKIRPYSMAAIVKRVKFNDEKIKEIMQGQEKIHATVGRNRKKVALGYYILDKIKFPVRYTAKSPKEIVFEPLDMPEKMDATQILSRHPVGREYANQLEGFDKFPVYYDANNEVLSMPPIINSNISGKILPGTTDVLIECSGNDLDVLKKVISLAVIDLIEQGGKAYSVDVVYGKKTEFVDLKPEKMKISLENTNKLLGLELKEKDLEKLLPRMGYEYKNGIVKIPAYRTDVLHEVDIIEDVAIAYGYENLIPEIPKVATIGEESKESKFRNLLASILTGLGLLETSSYHLIKDEEAKILGLKDKIELENSKTEYKILRPNLLIPITRIFAENKDKEYPQKVFEIGTIFLKDNSGKSETGIIEKENLIAAFTPGNFTEVKEALEYLFRMLKLEVKLKETSKKGFIEGRTGEILFSGSPIGYIGEMHPDILKEMNLKMPCAVFEISLDEILEEVYK